MFMSNEQADLKGKGSSCKEVMRDNTWSIFGGSLGTTLPDNLISNNFIQKAVGKT